MKPLTFKQYLSELPHIQFGDTFFDFEMERGLLLKRLTALLIGKKVKDKYGNELQLKTKKDIEKLLDIIKKDTILRSNLERLVKESIEEKPELFIEGILSKADLLSFKKKAGVIFSYLGKKIIATKHAIERNLERFKKAWNDSKVKEYFKKVIETLKNKRAGFYLIYSKSMEQGMIFKNEPEKEDAVIITILPKMKKFPKPGTLLIQIESEEIEIEVIEIS